MIALLLYILFLKDFTIFVLLILKAMQISIRIKVNEKIYLRNPEESALGRNIVCNGLLLINKVGFEDFTFKKLAKEINTTEASVYRYFENKQRLLIYIINWYWTFLEYKVMFNMQNIDNPEVKLNKMIDLLAIPVKEEKSDFISEYEAYKLIMWEGSKTFLTRNVSEDNKDKLFKPYKDLCARFASMITEYNPNYKFPHSLASTIIEMSHMQKFFMSNLPALTDFGNEKNDKKLHDFLHCLLFDTINSAKTKQSRK